MPPLYPAGFTGAGLLLLRLSVAGSLVALNLPLAPAGDIVQILALFVAFLLAAGLRVRAFALLSLIALPRAVEAHPICLLPTALHVATALALAFTGAGAYSLDARLFGHRRLRLRHLDDTSE